MSINLYKENPVTYEREILGPITEKQLDFLIENFEDEEFLLDAGTLDFLREQHADSQLMDLLEKALSGTENGVDILYLIE